MTPDGLSGFTLPEAVRATLDDFCSNLGVGLHLWLLDDSGRERVYPAHAPLSQVPRPVVCQAVHPRAGPPLEVQVELGEGIGEGVDPAALAALLGLQVERAFDYDHEVRFFTYELSERYEEINLLYSISETLGSILRLEDAARVILEEVCDVLQALRGSIWVYQPEGGILELVASFGRDGREGPIDAADPASVTARVFRGGRALMFGPERPALVVPVSPEEDRRAAEREAETVLSVPIRYTPPLGEARTVGVINLMGRRSGERFSSSDQKLLAAIASQVGAALENNRLIQESLAQERVSREMELAHDLQMKLLPSVENFDAAEVGARVMPAEQVGGDFYHLLKLPGGRLGVMIGDVSSHGFPAALMMALSMSAAAIYASEGPSPSHVLRKLDDALREELENTEMYLTLFYGVIDPGAGDLVYSNAGHPHAFVVHDEGVAERLTATDPPLGIAGPESYAERTVPWASGSDLLFLFTDGLSDLLATQARGSGEKVVLAEVIASRALPARDIVDRLFHLAENANPTIPSDDRTALLLRT